MVVFSEIACAKYLIRYVTKQITLDYIY